MVAIRSLLVAGAFPGLSAAAQVGIAADYVRVPVGCTFDACCNCDCNRHPQSWYHADQAQPQPATTQLTSAATDGANTVVNGVEGVLQTLELVPQPASRHLLQATPPPLTGDAQLVNTVGSLPELAGQLAQVSQMHSVLAAVCMAVNCGRTVPLKTLCSLPMRAINSDPTLPACFTWRPAQTDSLLTRCSSSRPFRAMSGE